MFGSRLKQLRKEKGLTQQQLAALLKIGRPTVAGYETKGKEPDFEKIMWLSAFFGVTTDYLLGISNNRGKP
jgi:transcriptional regulator with XRE-family HTH domain